MTNRWTASSCSDAAAGQSLRMHVQAVEQGSWGMQRHQALPGPLRCRLPLPCCFATAAATAGIWRRSFKPSELKLHSVT